MKKITFIAWIFISLSCFGQSEQNINNSKITTAIDKYIDDLIVEKGIPGLALAVLKDNKVIHKKNYGYASLEHQVPISDQSIFRVYSLTKPLVAVGVFRLIEQGKLSLEDFVSTYISDLPESWKSIQIKHLLSHSSGLPDMAPIPEFKELSEKEAKEKVFAQDCRFKPGSQYDYNQTGFWLLQKVIEKIEVTDLSSFILQHQFEQADEEVFFSSDSRDIVLHRTTPYFPFTKNTVTIDHSYLQGTYAHASNGLNISLAEFIKWDSLFYENKFLTPATKKMMWETFPYSEANKIFAYGWDKHVENFRVSYGFSGSLVTAYRIFPFDDLSIIFLSNGLTNFYNVENAINAIAEIALKE